MCVCVCLSVSKLIYFDDHHHEVNTLVIIALSQHVQMWRCEPLYLSSCQLLVSKGHINSVLPAVCMSAVIGAMT